MLPRSRSIRLGILAATLWLLGASYAHACTIPADIINNIVEDIRRVGRQTYVVLKAFAGRIREIIAAVAVIAAAFLLKLIFA